MAASTSTAADPNNNYYYDVFINHRGPDVKKTFASYLYRRLLSHGLRAFLDQQELQQGENLTFQIQGAIRTASVHVAIFSPRYAESNWCLEELVKMLETGNIIIPVFYNVKPSELRWTRGKDGKYAQDLQKLENSKTHEDKSRYESFTIESWRNALSSVAGISGFDLEACNGDEGELLDNVVDRVLKVVKKSLSVAKYPAGLDEKVKDFENQVLVQQRERGKPPVLGIVGLGGVGKTTLAKELFNRKSSHYRRSCFLSNVRDAGKSSLISLQNKLVKSLAGSDHRIDNIDEGIETLKKLFSHFQALVVLDDIDQVDQLDTLLPDQTVLRSDSLVVITSRDKDVLTSSGVLSIYKLTGLNARYSRELFCCHAFNQPYPLPVFESLVEEFLKACNGLPLSLKVTGALLYGRNDISYWKDQLDRLKQILPSEIQQKLKISYDALNEQEKQIFLDIAWFFIGQNRDTAIRIWDGSGWKGRLLFQNLESKCLVEVDSENIIHMHDHVRDLGRNVEQASRSVSPWHRNVENIDELLQQSSVITEVRGITMGVSNPLFHLSGIPDDISLPKIRWLRGMLQLSHIPDDISLERILRRVHPQNVIWLSCYYCYFYSLPSWIPIENLRVLQMSGISLKTLWQGESQAPLQLRELEIVAPLSEIPKSIGKLKHLERIVVFRCFTGQISISKLPKEFCNLQSLKELVLSYCSEMKSLPECFGNLGNLQHIDLSKCHNLESLPNSFKNLMKLKYLDLNGCCNLTMETQALGNISTLEYMDLSCCEKIEVLPQQVVHQRSLETLYLADSRLKELPSMMGDLSNLEVLGLGSPLLDTLPASLGDLRNLRKLMLSDCPKVKCLPAAVGRLTQFTELKVRDCSLVRLVEQPYSNLDSSIGQCMPRLQNLKLNSTKLSDLSFAEGVCPNLQRLSIRWCHQLVGVGTLPNTLIKLKLISCYNLRKIEGLCGLSKLQRLDISDCKMVQELPSIDTLVSLEEFEASQCVKLKSIQGLAPLKNLRIISVQNCVELDELEGLKHCISLKKLDTSGCPKLRWNGECSSKAE